MSPDGNKEEVWKLVQISGVAKAVATIGIVCTTAGCIESTNTETVLDNQAPTISPAVDRQAIRDNFRLYASDPDPSNVEGRLLEQTISQLTTEDIPFLIDMLKGNLNQAVQIALIEAFSQIGSPAVPQVVNVLDNEENATSQAAHLSVLILGRIAQNNVDAAEAILRAYFKLSNEEKTHPAFGGYSWPQSLMSIGPVAIPALLTLEQNKIDTDYLSKDLQDVELSTFFVRVVKMGPETYPYFVDAIADESIHDLAVSMLVEMISSESFRNDLLIHALIAGFQKGKPIDNYSAIILARGKESVVGQLVDALESLNEDSKFWALVSLHQIGPNAAAAIHPLRIELSQTATPNDMTRRLIIQTIQQIGPAGRAALPQLVQSLSDPNTDNRALAAQALGALGPAAKGAADALSRMAKNSNESPRNIDMARSAYLSVTSGTPMRSNN